MTSEHGVPAGLVGTEGTLLDAYDLLLLDLDGVAYLGDRPIDGVADALSAARGAGDRLIFITNNAARPPSEVAEQLTSMGVTASAEEVMTSAMAAARDLADRFPPGTPVLVVGGAGVRDALQAAGLRPVERADEHPKAVLQGFAPEVGWRALAEASVAIRAGAVWVATNTDVTLPSPRGPLPGNGSLVAALAAATGLRPQVIGKPEPPLFTAALEAGGGSHPLVVGDRLDTDIAGARNAGLPSLLVLSGVSTGTDLVAAEPSSRPNYVGRDLRALTLRHPTPSVSDGTAACGAVTASLAAGEVSFGATSAPATPDGLDALRALCALAWSASPTEPAAEQLARYDRALTTLDG